jgi:F1F0 ATPase subunit 2
MLVGLAMDAKHMNSLAPVLYFVSGIACGIVYFRFLWWDVRRFAAAGSLGITILSMLVRVALLGGILTFASKQGALPLLLMALGVVIARFLVARGIRATVP